MRICTSRQTDKKSRTEDGWSLSTGGGWLRNSRALSTQYLLASANEVMNRAVGMMGAKNRPKNVVLTREAYRSAKSHVCPARRRNDNKSTNQQISQAIVDRVRTAGEEKRMAQLRESGHAKIASMSRKVVWYLATTFSIPPAGLRG